MRLSSILALAPLALASFEGGVPQSFINTAIARTIELGGSTHVVTTQYNVKALVDNPETYVLALGKEGDEPPAWYEVLVAGQPVQNVVTDNVEGAPAALVPIGKMKKDGTVTISLNEIVAKASRPVPAEVEQRAPQYIMWETNSTLVDSVYTSDVERIKIRAPSPEILGQGKVPKTYTRDSDVTKSGATITLGPFYSVPPTLGKDAKGEQSPYWVHYETKVAIAGIRSLRRTAEVSHWGANLNIQDEIELFNNGPRLKGQFSRLNHQQSRFWASKPAQVLSELVMRLPPLARSVYYYDVIGNVSTSHFREGVAGKGRTTESQLEFRPRYPLLGGWNYTFTVGWDSPLSESVKVDQDGKYILSVPFLTPMKDVVVDDEELQIILPEGATDVQVHTPFPVDEIDHSVHKTYLDTTGRPAVTLKKHLVTENHAQPVYVTYNYSRGALFKKPLTVAAFCGSILLLFVLLRRVDYRIEKKKQE